VNHLGHPLVGLAVGTPADDEQGKQEHDESAQTHADPNQKIRHNPAAVENEPAG
jgi:hypothetical protein